MKTESHEDVGHEELPHCTALRACKLPLCDSAHGSVRGNQTVTTTLKMILQVEKAGADTKLQLTMLQPDNNPNCFTCCTHRKPTSTNTHNGTVVEFDPKLGAS